MNITGLIIIIEEFLKTNNIIISLTLVEDLEKEASNKIVIERNFRERKDRITTINGFPYLNIDDEFSPK